jgi:hypothetical protein
MLMVLSVFLVLNRLALIWVKTYDLIGCIILDKNVLPKLVSPLAS